MPFSISTIQNDSDWFQQISVMYHTRINPDLISLIKSIIRELDIDIGCNDHTV